MTFGTGIPVWQPPCSSGPLQPEDVCGEELARKMVIGASWTGWMEVVATPQPSDLTAFTVTAEFYIAQSDAPLTVLTLSDGLTIGSPAYRVKFDIDPTFTAQALAQTPRMPCPTRLVGVLTDTSGGRTYFGLQLFLPIDRKTTGDLPEGDYDYIWLPQ